MPPRELLQKLWKSFPRNSHFFGGICIRVHGAHFLLGGLGFNGSWHTYGNDPVSEEGKQKSLQLDEHNCIHNEN